MVTLEDILEEIVGEISDEYDSEEVEVEQVDPECVRVSSRFSLGDLDDRTRELITVVLLAT